jgi:hypothetical protein
MQASPLQIQTKEAVPLRNGFFIESLTTGFKRIENISGRIPVR